jgi:hypothetical protein
MSQRDIAYQPRATLWETCPAPGRVLKERRLSPHGRRVPDPPRMRRSFRTHESGHAQTQGVALGWYASPLQGDSKCPNSRSPRQREIGFLTAGVRRPFRKKQGPLVESIATIRSIDVVGSIKRGERVIDVRLRTVAKTNKDVATLLSQLGCNCPPARNWCKM